MTPLDWLLAIGLVWLLGAFGLGVLIGKAIKHGNDDDHPDNVCRKDWIRVTYRRS